MARWMTGGQQRATESGLQILRKRLPWWSLLIGAWLSARYWPLTLEGHLLVGRTAFVLGALSVTFAVAALASESVDTYRALISPALPVSSLTRNVAWSLVAILGLLVILNGLGLSITPMLTALGVGGLAVSRFKSHWRTSSLVCSSRSRGKSASATTSSSIQDRKGTSSTSVGVRPACACSQTT